MSESETQVEMYCPACGETSAIELVILMPGEDTFICDCCKTVWRVDVQFKEVSDDQST